MKKGIKKAIQMGKVLTNLDGKEMVFSGDGPTDAKPMTVGSVLTAALLHPKNENERTTAETKLHRFELAREIHAAGPGSVSLSGEDISILKDLVNNIFSALVVGQTFMYLDAGELEKKEESEDEQ